MPSGDRKGYYLLHAEPLNCKKHINIVFLVVYFHIHFMNMILCCIFSYALYVYDFIYLSSIFRISLEDPATESFYLVQ